MRGADVARVARSLPAAAVGRASVRAICAAAGSCAGTPSTMIAVGKLIEHRPARSLRMGDVRNAPTRSCTKLSPATIRVAAKRTVPLCGGPVYEDKSAFLLPDSGIAMASVDPRRQGSAIRVPAPVDYRGGELLRIVDRK